MKRGTYHEGEYWHSTHGVDYTVSHFVQHHPSFEVSLPCFGCVESMIGDVDVDEETLVSIPCHLTSKEDYYQIQGKQFADRLRSYYPDISDGCAAKVAETFMEIVQIANATHNCIECQPGVTFDATHIVVVKIHPHHHAAVEKEAVGPIRWPATRSSVVELLKASSTTAKEEEQQHECTICIEEMQPSKRLAMPCSHSFHPACLLPWLDHNHFCPLCRYQLPHAEYRSFC